jgi:hypothetical protein
MKKSLTKSKRNYGLLTDFSKEINRALGDNSGRTVSRRTAHGIQRSFRLENMSDDDAEDVAHGAMLATTGLLLSKNDGAKAAGLLLLFGLIACYQNGK